jgi:nitrite reductase/ring-hydroxylating ferredoxin subunit
MKRPEALVAISRRQFCGSLAGCVGVAAIAACGGGGGSTVDAPLPPSDGETNGTCTTTGATDVGAPSTFMTGQPVYFSQGNFFVVRDAGGLYALTARCTHQGGTVRVSGTQFRCPLHGATYNFDGEVTGPPAPLPLKHLAMCMTASGNVGVQPSMPVAENVRLNV